MFKTIKGFFSSLNPKLVTICVVAGIAGVAVLLAGVAFDSESTWIAEHGFLANIWSSVALSLLAFPLVTIAIAELTAKSAGYRERIALQKMLRRVSRDFELRIDSCVRRSRGGSDLQRALAHMQDLENPFTEPDYSVEPYREPEFKESGFSLMARHWDVWDTEFPSPEAVANNIKSAGRLWELLVSLKLDTIKADFSWLSFDIEDVINANLMQAQYSVEQLRSKGVDSFEYHTHANMLQAIQNLHQLSVHARHVSNTFLFGAQREESAEP